MERYASELSLELRRERAGNENEACNVDQFPDTELEAIATHQESLEQ